MSQKSALSFDDAFERTDKPGEIQPPKDLDAGLQDLPPDIIPDVLAALPPQPPQSEAPKPEVAKSNTGTQPKPVNPNDHNESITIEVKQIRESDIGIPQKASEDSSYYDIYVDLTGTSFGNEIFIPPNVTRSIPTNLQFFIPKGFEIQVRPKQGYTLPGIIVLYTPLTLDATTKEELKIDVLNLSGQAARLKHGQKIAQIAITRIPRSKIVLAKRGKDASSATK
jgi:dUTP pyrophosphatase